MNDYVRIAVPRIDVDYIKNFMKVNPNFNISNIFIHEYNGRLHYTTLALYAVENEDEELLDYFISENVDLNVEFSRFGTPLFAAVTNNNLKLIKKLHESGADINRGISHPLKTPLGEAVMNSYFDIAEYLVNNGADVNATTTTCLHYGHTPVLIAATKGYNDILKLLLNNNAKSYYARIKLSNLNVNGVREILNTTPNIDINSIFICEKFQHYHQPPARIPNVNTIVICKECRDYAPLPLVHLAIEYKNEELLDYLINSNADLNNCIPGHGTPLHVAIGKRDFDLIIKLIESGADVNAQSAEWLISPLAYATWIRSLEVAEYLIDKGANVNAISSICHPFNNVTPLQIAAGIGYKDFVHLLLQNNADINVKTSTNGDTPIMYACNSGNLGMMKMFVARGADCDEDVFFSAVKNGNHLIINYLLELDLDAIDIHFFQTDLEDSFFYQTFKKYRGNLSDLIFLDFINVIFDAGFDINSVDHDNKLIIEIIDEPRILNYFKHNIVKLKQAGFHVCQRNIEATEGLRGLKGKKYNNFPMKCDQEIAKLKNEHVGRSNLRFYEVLHKNYHSISIRLRHTNTNSIINRKILLKKYPIYGNMIYYKLAKARRRIKLLKNVEEFLDYVLNFCSKLPYTFTRNLYMYLTNENLKKLM